MAIIELVKDDFCDDDKCVKVGNVVNAIARRFLADGSPNKFQAERDAWPLIHTGIIAGKLHAIDQTNRQQLSADNCGDGMVLFDELVEWGKWCKRFDFVNQQAVLALEARRKARLERAITPQGSGCAPRYSPPPITIKPPNWGKWRHMPTVSPWEACTLALNIGPDSVDYSPETWDGQPEKWRGFPSDVGGHFLNLLRLLNANQFEKQHFTENFAMGVRLSEFAAWCAPIVRDIAGHDIPQELAALAVKKLPEATGASSDAAAKGEAPVASPSGDDVEEKAPAKERSISKSAVINAFDGLHFDRNGWNNALSDVPNWIEPCRVTLGRKGDKTTPATWNPALIAAALFDKKISIKKLDAVFVRLKDWADEWREVSASFRD